MRNFKHRKLVTWISLAMFLVVGIIGTIFAFANKTVEGEKTIYNTNNVNDTYYEDLMNDKFDLATAHSGFLQFEFDNGGGQNYTAKLVGFNNVGPGNNLFDKFHKFLEIPTFVTSNNITYKVTEIDFTDVYNTNTSAAATTQTIAHYISGIKIPTSVQKISENAFAAFGSLEYFETPFVGTERGSSAWYLIDFTKGEQVVRASKPFVSMFDNPNNTHLGVGNAGIFIGYESDGVELEYTYNNSTDTYIPTVWYETGNVTSARQYRMPIKLSKVVITDEYSLGNHAVWNILSLKYLDVAVNPEYLQENFMWLGESTFSDNPELLEINLPIIENVKMDTAEGLLRNNPKLEEVRLPGSTLVPDSCFALCSSLKKVYLPSSTQVIEQMAFNDCQNLENIFFYSVGEYDPNAQDPNLRSGTIDFTTSLTTIGTGAFTNCQKFKDVTIHEQVTEIGFEAFKGCNSIESLIIPFVGAHRGACTNTCTGSYHTCFGYIFGIGTDAVNATYGALETYGSSQSAAFGIPIHLKTLKITAETKLLYGALQNLKSVEYLYLPTTLNQIDAGCMKGMSNLFHLEIPFTNGHVGVCFGQEQFIDNSAYLASSYYIPSTLEEIEITNQGTISGSNFHNCTSLVTVVIGNATSVIDSGAFFNTTSLYSLTVPFVGRQRGYFTNTYNHRWTWWWWRDINIRDAFEWIFSSTSSNNTYANQAQYYYYSGWYTRYIPISLKEVTITDDTSISSLAFESQAYIEKLTINAGNIDEGALKGMARLEELTVPYIGYNSNPYGYDGRNRTIGYIFGDYDNGHTYSYESHYGFNIPNLLKRINITGNNPAIPNYAFQNCKSLLTVDIRGPIGRLGYAAFQNCTNLQSLNIPNASYTSVSDYAFYNDVKLFEIEKIIPVNRVNTVGNYSFYGTSVGGPSYPIDYSKFTTIGDYAFGNCVEIKSITLTDANTSIGKGAFSGCQSLTDVTLSGKVSPYMFENCYLLEKIDFRAPVAITVIPEGIFKNCYNLKYSANNEYTGFVISPETTSIGAYAFYNCASFDRFIIPVTCKSVGNYAFSKCTGLEYMTIPYETTTLGIHGWDDCDANFYFYVYKPESQWPSTWPNNWNCNYPVYIIGDVDSNLFTYEYDTDHKGYFITGVEDGVVLRGQIKLPSRHNGLNVYGITNTNSTNPLFDQVGITSIIVPKSMYYLSSNIYDGVLRGCFQTGNRIDVYFEATAAEIAKYQATQASMEAQGTAHGSYVRGWTIGDTTMDGKLGLPSAFEKGLINYGFVFYGDSWTYINITGDSKAPAIKASCLSIEYNFGYQTMEYTGYQIKADDDDPINKIIYDSAILVDSQELPDYAGTIYPCMFDSTDYEEDYTKIFGIQYANNINAGTATITANLKTGLYNDYISRLGDYPLYINGTNVYKFTIEKADIYLFSNDYADLYEITNAVYTGSPWAYTFINNDNVLGLNNFGATFTGTLSTSSANVGTYTSDLGALGGFRWSTQYKITRNGVDLTSNFNVILNLSVKVNPMRLTIAWQDDTPEIDTTVLDYRYNGSTIVKPRAVFKEVTYNYLNTDTQATEAEKSTFTTNTITTCKMVIENDHNYTTSIFPNDTTTYGAFAYIDSAYTNNYVLVYPETAGANAGKIVPTGAYTASKNTQTYTALGCTYRIIKGLVTISIDLVNEYNQQGVLTRNDAYKIPTDADYWEINFNSTNVENAYVSGLGTGTIFLAHYRTKEIDETDENNYYYNADNEKIILGDKQKTYNITNSDIVTVDTIVRYTDTEGTINNFGGYDSYHFYRANGTSAPIPEDDCYEITYDKFRVQIVYDDFDVKYYVIKVDASRNVIAGETPVEVFPSPVEEVYTEGGVEKTRTVMELTYEVDGYYYLMFTDVENKDEIVNYSMDYLIEEGTGSTSRGLFFREANKTYFFSANIVGRHYNQKQIPIRLKTIKSTVTIADNADKQYDRKAYDLNQYITKRDMVSDNPAQVITIDYYDRDFVTSGYNTIPGKSFASFQEFLESDIDKSDYTIAPPIEVGKYTAVVNATETDYFNALENKIKNFEIIKRIIYIDVDGSGVTFAESPITGERKYNGTEQTFTPDSDNLANIGYLLGEEIDGNGNVLVGADIFSGVLRTRSKNPGTYSSAIAGDFVWDTPFKVVSALTGDDITHNYQVIVRGNFTIKNLDFTITEYPVDCVYDGSTKYAYVEVSLDQYYDGGLTYTVYYSLTPIDPNKLSIYQIGVPPMFTTPNDTVINVYYYVTGDYYNPQSGVLTVKIDPREIIYSDPATLDAGLYKMIWPYDDSYHEYVVTVTDPWYAVVYYSLDNQTWQTAPFMVRDVNKDDPLKVYYKIEAQNYTTINGGPVFLIVTDEDFPELEDELYNVQGATYTYDGDPHTITIINNNNTATLSYSIDQTTWTDTLPEYVDAGGYTIYVKFYVSGYKQKIKAATLTINKRTFKDLSIETKINDDAITFDGQYHTLNVIGQYFSYEDVEVIDEDNPTIRHIVRKYYYDDPDTGIREEVTLSYSNNKFSIDAGYGFSSDKLEYKDANAKPYIIIIKISNKNYEDYIVGDGTTVGLLQINVAPGVGTYTFTQIEYSKATFDPSKLNITTVHDGQRIYRYWPAYYDNGVMKCDFEEKVPDPRELGLYCFTVDFYGSRNVESFSLGANNNDDPTLLIFFEIVPKQLEVKYLEEAYYSGEPFAPNPYVETGTTDELIIDSLLIKTEINNVVDDNPDPDMEVTEVGVYTYQIWIHGGNDNYVLDTYEIEMRIVKRALDISLTLTKEYDGKIYAKSNHPQYDYTDPNRIYEYIDWNISAGLLPEHKILMTLESSRNAITTYTKTYGVDTLASNRVIIKDFDIVLMEPRKENGNIVYENGKPVYDYVMENGNYVSVKHLYDITGELVIKITKQVFDIESIGSETITYDGYEHTLKIFDSQNYVGSLAKLAGATIYCLWYDGDGVPHMTTPTPHTDAGVYTYEVQVIKSGYETSFATLTLTIEKADLNVDVYDLDQVGLDYDIYDDEYKTTIYTVDNINPEKIEILNQDSDLTFGSIRYYSVNDYSQQELQSFYRNFDENNAIFRNSLKEIKEAGDYYCVVYYKDTDKQWNESITIRQLTIKKREIHINLYNTETESPSREYNGEKLVIGLGGYVPGWGESLRRYTFVTNDLVPGHSIDNSYSRQSTFSIRTISANADVYYGYNGFEFNIMEIIGRDGSNVANNYKPVLSDNVRATITKAYLTPDLFRVSGNSKNYDTEECRPVIDTASDGNITAYYQEYTDYDGNLVDSTRISGFPKNAGIYRVTVKIGDGRNYYGSDRINPVTGQALGDQVVDVFIYKTTIEVEWDNLVKVFNGQKQSATATITEANGNVVRLKVYYYEDIVNNITTDGYIPSGSYQAYAEFGTGLNGANFNVELYNNNYNLRSTSATFRITNAEYELNIGSRKVKLPIGDRWIGEFDTSMITNFPDYLTLTGSTSTNPQVRTKYSAPGTYSSSSLFDLYYKITIQDGNDIIDVTKSVTFNVIGSVIIESNEVPYTATDKVLTYQYGGYSFESLNALVISASIASSCHVTYRYYATAFDTTITQKTSDFTLIDVGTYEIDVLITCTGYQNTYATITIVIEPRDATVTFKADLNKTYDGVAVSSDNLVSSTESHYTFNGVYSDLIYEYYQYNDGFGGSFSLLPGAPADAGDYFIRVTCNETLTNSNGLQNYTVLSKTLDFQIKPKEINLKIELDETLTVGQVGDTWSITKYYTPGQLTNELASYDYLYFSLSIPAVARTTYMADILLSNKQAPNGYPNPFVGTHMDTGVSIPDTYLLSSFVAKSTTDTIEEEDRTWNVKWLIYRAEDNGQTLTQCGDVTGNYDIRLDFDAYFHLQLIKGWTVTGVGEAAGLPVQAYTGNTYGGSITHDQDYTVGVTAQFSLNATYFDDSSHASEVYANINNNNIMYSLPGKYLVHYKLSNGDSYEPIIGSYYIDIQKIDNPIYIDDIDTKIYDASSIYTDYLGIGYVTPRMYFRDHTDTVQLFDTNGNFSFQTNQGELIQNTVNMSGIVVSYKYGNTTLSGAQDALPINAGTYTCTIVIPETLCCLEKTLTFNFTISKRVIKVYDVDSSNPASMVYNMNRGVYNDLMSGDYYTFKYVLDDGTEIELADTNLTFDITGTIVTSGINVETYLGSNKGSGSKYIYFNAEPTVEVNNDSSVSTNYAVNLDNASYKITPATQSVYDVTPSSFDYDGNYHEVKIQCLDPGPQFARIEIFDEDLNAWVELYEYDAETNNPISLKTKYAVVDATEAPGKQFRWRSVAANYEPYEGYTYVMVNTIPTTVDIRTPLEKIYNGEEVLIPEDIYTNSTRQDSTEYTYIYYKWEKRQDNTYEWALLSTFKWNPTGGEFGTGGYESEDPDLEVHRPVNVGKYMVEVIIPRISNYGEGRGTKEFTISAREIELVWGNDQLTYNGLSQSIRVDAPQVNNDKQNINDIGIVLPVTITPIRVGGDPLHKAVGSYQAVADISILSDNYIVDQSTIRKTFTINPQIVLVQVNATISYTGDPYNFDVYDQQTHTGYLTSGLCYSQQDGVDHRISGQLQLFKTQVRTNPYKVFGQTKDYMWINNGSNGDTCVILDENGTQVQSNYIINYNLSTTINFSKISITIEGSEGYEDINDTNWTYIYEKNVERYLTVYVTNADAENYTVLYSNEENGSYTQSPLKYINVSSEGTPDNPGFYTIYYRVFKNGDSGNYELATQYLANTAYYDIQLENVTNDTFVPNKYYRYSNQTGKYELAANYIGGSDYYLITEVRNVTSGNFQPNQYYVSMDGYPPVSGSATITIIPRNAQLSFVNPLKELSKTYDGNPILKTDHPATCEDEDAEILYKYYYYDENAEGHKGLEVKTNGYPSQPVNKGKYVLEVSISGQSRNYESTPIRHEFEIYARNIIINVGPVEKVFDYLVWQKKIENTDIKMNDNGNYVDGIVNGQTFVGYLNTISHLIGNYTDFDTSFAWNRNMVSTDVGYKIVDASGKNVTENYTLSYNLDVSITKAPISVKVYPITLTYDAEEHSIEYEIVPSRRKDAFDNYVTYPVPETPLVRFSTDGINWSTHNPTFRLAGTYPVWIEISAPNYQTIVISNGSYGYDENGDSKIYQSYVKIEGVTFDGGHLEYGGRTDASNYYYSGYPYPTPYYADSPSQGVQTVKYYTEEVYAIYKAQYDMASLGHELTEAEIQALRAQYLDPYEIQTPVEAGRYHFILTIASDGIYDEEEFNASFRIYQKEITINWKDINDENALDGEQLTKEFTGNPLKPTAYFIRVDNTKVPLSVEFVKDLSNGTAITDDLTVFRVGQYEVKASLVDANDIKNYVLVQPKDTFTISKHLIDDLLIPTDLEVLFGDELIIVDTDGNTLLLNDDGIVVYKVPATHVIYIDGDGDTAVGIDLGGGNYDDSTKVILSDGTLAAGIEPYPYSIEIDEDKSVGEHNIRVVLTDTDNNMWRGQRDSNDLVYKYKVTPITIPDNSGRFRINIALDKSTMIIDEAKPLPIVTVIDQDNGNAETVLVLDVDYEIQYLDEENWATDLENSQSGRINGIIQITGKGNYSIDTQKVFNIIDRAPDLLTIEDGSPLQYIKAKFDQETESMYYLEDEFVVDPRSTDNYSAPDQDGYSFYLGHIHQEMFVRTLLAQFTNTPENVKIFSAHDYTTPDDNDSSLLKYQIQPDRYETTYVGTGYWVVLFDDHGNVVDEIECVVYGDLDGDGLSNANDINIVKKYMMGTITIDPNQDYVSTTDSIKLSQAFAGVINRQDFFALSADTINYIKKYMMGETGSDFNSDYTIEEQA